MKKLPNLPKTEYFLFMDRETAEHFGLKEGDTAPYVGGTIVYRRPIGNEGAAYGPPFEPIDQYATADMELYRRQSSEGEE